MLMGSGKLTLIAGEIRSEYVAELIPRPSR
jgi:hypothetical protein